MTVERLSNLQETYKSLIESEGTGSFIEASENKSIDKKQADRLISLAITMREMANRNDGYLDWQPRMMDLVWAQELIDGLDTLGWEVVPKHGVRIRNEGSGWSSPKAS